MRPLLILSASVGLLAGCTGEGPPIGGSDWGDDVPEAVALGTDPLPEPPRGATPAPVEAEPEAEAEEEAVPEPEEAAAPADPVPVAPGPQPEVAPVQTEPAEPAPNPSDTAPAGT